MNFRPNRWKLLISFVIITIWYMGIIGYLTIECDESRTCPGEPCEKNIFELIPSNCKNHCECPPTNVIVSKFFYDLTIILIPGVIFYIISSLAMVIKK